MLIWYKYRFCSSHELNGIYANNLQAAASIFLSGNNYAKIVRMANFYGLSFLSKSTYYQFQHLYLIPEVNDWWCWMRRELVGEFAGKVLLLVVMVSVTLQVSMPRIFVTSW